MISYTKNENDQDIKLLKHAICNVNNRNTDVTVIAQALNARRVKQGLAELRIG
jgi:hypothetical protein